jgi:hypothetical protein
VTEPLDDIQARCKANATKAKRETKSIERARWKSLTAAQEPRVAPNWAKVAPKEAFEQIKKEGAR